MEQDKKKYVSLLNPLALIRDCGDEVEVSSGDVGGGIKTKV
jgi:hypothetical protein